MTRPSRAEAQRRNRAKVLAAARAEFAERGFRDAKVDRIADRADLTRGAVYSNFPGKRALYFAVLADAAERVLDAPYAVPPVIRTPDEALGGFARAWLARLPLSSDHPLARLGTDLMPEVLAEDLVRLPFTQLLKLEAILLGLGLERLSPLDRAGQDTRKVRTAETALTMLYGASELAGSAPGFVEPFDVVSACEQLATLDLADGWPPPHTAHAPTARPVDEPWSPPVAVDQLRGTGVDVSGDGVLTVLGLHRLSAIEEVVRVVPVGTEITAVLVTGAPKELMPLVRLVLAEFRDGFRQAFPTGAWPELRLVRDDAGEVAAAAGLPVVSDATETAVYLESGRIVARADGFGACHAVGLAVARRNGQG